MCQVTGSQQHNGAVRNGREDGRTELRSVLRDWNYLWMLVGFFPSDAQ